MLCLYTIFTLKLKITLIRINSWIHKHPGQGKRPCVVFILDLYFSKSPAPYHSRLQLSQVHIVANKPPPIARNSQTTYLGVFLGKELHILNRLLLKVYISLIITTDGTLNTDSSVRGVKSPGSRRASLRLAQSPLTG